MLTVKSGSHAGQLLAARDTRAPLDWNWAATHWPHPPLVGLRTGSRPRGLVRPFVKETRYQSRQQTGRHAIVSAGTRRCTVRDIPGDFTDAPYLNRDRALRCRCSSAQRTVLSNPKFVSSCPSVPVVIEHHEARIEVSMLTALKENVENPMAKQ